jgi:hypothetical protein
MYTTTRWIVAIGLALAFVAPRAFADEAPA